MKKLVVICGPTGTGKTGLGIKLCKKYNGEIVSADSRQVYKGADIGTNKASVTEKLKNRKTEKNKRFRLQEGVRIYLYDVTTPDKQYSASKFIDAAAEVIKKIWRPGKLPFVVGGTGFYISALLGEVKLSGVPADQELRDELNINSLENLRETLKSLAPAKFGQMNNSELKNKQRLIRAIEVAVASKLGRKKPRQKRAPLPEINILKIGLMAPRKIMYHQADRWAHRIVMSRGLIRETKNLLEHGYRNTRLLQGMIYAPAVSHLDGKLPKIELVKTIQGELHAYIRRQMTWFKKDKKIHWFDITEVDFDREVVKLVESFLRKT
ncbi:MAG: tRNA (adenosine(37)-N6)-dimethylallyltransferase MiaA [Candidatus Cloacimonetes bacterium]|nr:tRNA (adenosine(37)-N6)-dimethylallyltransferase MiaA [Candidatus Cloacimonadota bacterium]